MSRRAKNINAPAVTADGKRKLGIALACFLIAMTAPTSAPASDFLVTSSADLEADDGLCTLREVTVAIASQLESGSLPGECPAGTSENTVRFDLPHGTTIASAFAPFVFERSVEILGPGAENLVIASGGVSRVLIFDGVDAPRSFSLSGVTISGGNAIEAYEFRFDDAGGGLAAIQPQELTLRGVVFRNNTAELQGGGAAIEMRADGEALIEDCSFEGNSIFSKTGGGGGALQLFRLGTLSIRRTLFAENSVTSGGTPPAEDPDGGALQIAATADGTLLIENSTFSNNRAQGEGGAIVFGSTLASTGPTVLATIDSVTIVRNNADTDEDSTTASGGGMHTLYSDEVVALRNSILAINVDGSAAPGAPNLNATPATLTSSGFNWIGTRLGAESVFLLGQPNGNLDWVGSVLSPLNPMLQQLDDYGGPSRSHAPVENPLSPLVDRGSCSGQGSADADQRGWWNPDSLERIFDEATVTNQGDGCDIGAVEAFLEDPIGIFSDGFESGSTTEWSETTP